MALLYPDSLPQTILDDPRRAADVAVYEALARLGDDFAVLYSVAWLAPLPGSDARDGEVAFLVAHPARGLLLVELVAGEVSFDAAANEWLALDPVDRSRRSLGDPFAQAEVSQAALRAKLRSLPSGGHLGSGAGGWSAGERVEYTVVFPETSRGALVADLSAERVRRVMAREDLGRIGPRLDAVWPQRTATDGARPAVAARQLADRLSRLFGLAREMRLPLGEQIYVDDREIIRLTENQFAMLGQLQRVRQAAISGGAGSGKTMLALEKAKRLAAEGHRTLLTCYNRPLADFLRESAGRAERLTVESFHALCHHAAKEAGLPQPDLESLEEQREEYDTDLLPSMLTGALERGYRPFEAIVVDEGQDFRAEWMDALRRSLADAKRAPLYIFFDNNQRLYVEGAPIPPELPEIALHHNLRNTQTIHRLAYRFYRGARHDGLGPEGRPVVRHAIARASEAEEVVAGILRRLIDEENVPPDEIAVLTTRPPQRLEFAQGETLGGYAFSTDPRGADERGGDGAEGRLVVQTVFRFKGLERPVVILVAPEMPSRIPPEALLYVGMTRARAHLEIVATPEVLGLLAKA